jgi:HD superfamily phosphodiesterase
MRILSNLFHFVSLTSKKYNIDESHGLSHSMNALYYASQIYKYESVVNPHIIHQERLIYVSAVVHDMCDKKYVNQEEGVQEIQGFLQDKLTPFEVESTKKIISTMSYSTVKKNGYPELGEIQDAYHIVREADLLTAYDFDRSMIYHINTNNANLEDAYTNAKELFVKRVLRHNKDKLFKTKYGILESHKLHISAINRMDYWKDMINKIL